MRNTTYSLAIHCINLKTKRVTAIINSRYWSIFAERNMPMFVLRRPYDERILFFSCSPSQVYPRATTLTFTTCSLSITTITITPTIPARQNSRSNWPMISFWLPKEIQLVDNEDQCELELRGTTPILLRIKATCPAAGATEGLKAIVPHISTLHSKFWHLDKVGLPTIWVRRWSFQFITTSKISPNPTRGVTN